MTKKRGFTLIEVLSVIGIVLALIALTMPVIANAKKGMYERACVSNLKQLHMAITIYRQEWDGDGVFGDAYEMGLPPFPFSGRLPLMEFRCAEAGNDAFSTEGVHYYSFWSDPQLDGNLPSWETYSQEYRGEAILIVDMNHNPKHLPLLHGDLLTRYGFGLSESGVLVKGKKRGDWFRRTWWNTP